MLVVAFNSLIYISCIIISISLAYDIQNQFDATEFLARFGYMDKTIMNEISLVDIRPYVKVFQKRFGINTTGQLDQETLSMMNKPRCGCLDLQIPLNSPDSRSLRYTTFGRKWEKRELVYRLSQYSHKVLDRRSVDNDVDKAFELWSSVTNLIFIKAADPYEKVDIELKFVAQTHEDAYPFDGPGYTVAHAFAPGEGIGGDVHYDDHEVWTTDSNKGTNILYVSVHEIGHALGLAHSTAKGAIMEANYGGYRPNLQLHSDDISGIQHLYGSKSLEPSWQSPTVTPRVPPPKHFPPQITPNTKIETMTRRPFKEGHHVHREGHSPPRKETEDRRRRPSFSRADICENPKLDAITTLSDGDIYLFKGSYVYKIDSNGEGLLPGWPNRIEYIFKGLQSGLDAALTRRKAGSTYFFKHDKYWRFNGTKLDPKYPKEIGRHFPGIPDNIDAAFEWSHDGHMYFFKGDKYWGFNPFQRPYVSSHYPLPISTIGLKVDSIDGAFTAPHGKVYLFKENQYWRLQDNILKIAHALPPYPRDSRIMWWKCTLYKPDLTDI